MNLLVQLFKYFGIISAFVIALGFYSKSDGSLLERVSNDAFSEEELPPTQEYATLGLDKARADLRSGTYRSPVSSGRTLNLPATSGRSGDREIVAVSHKAARDTYSENGTISSRDLNSWLEMSSAQTYLEAEKETISPGVILATGVYFLEQGESLNLTAADVASYLADLRDNASAKAKAHMKYIANSQEWFKGLSIAGFDGQRIAEIYDRLGLKAYDKAMYNRHVERKIEQSDYTGEPENLEADVEVRRANLADAYNDYADRPEVRKKYSLPSAPKTASASTDEEVSEGRREAESFRKGEAKTYDNPRLFWAVLQEMIALEEGYASWDAYQKENPSTAERKFQKRSDIMALGGEMKITRR